MQINAIYQSLDCTYGEQQQTVLKVDALWCIIDLKAAPLIIHTK